MEQRIRWVNTDCVKWPGEDEEEARMALESLHPNTVGRPCYSLLIVRSMEEEE